MIAVIFEVWPADGERQTYLDIAARLRPELDEIDGFISIERFESLTEPGEMLSLVLARRDGGAGVAPAGGTPPGAGSWARVGVPGLPLTDRGGGTGLRHDGEGSGSSGQQGSPWLIAGLGLADVAQR